MINNSFKLSSTPKLLLKQKEEQMEVAVTKLDFETAALIRDELVVLRSML
ncbi:MAG: UvrB/UvrC motif-containing protein [Patescibacteria group bacterium]